MAIILEANYSKKVGLPGYSSHQFSLTLKTEITDPSQVQNEAHKLYEQLQQGVDASLKEVGWLPEANGKPNGHSNAGNGNGHHPNANGHSHPRNGREEPWQCSPKQRELIIRIVDENRLDKSNVEQLANDRFGKGVKQLNKLEASGLIEELIEQYPSKNSRHQRQPAPAR